MKWITINGSVKIVSAAYKSGWALNKAVTMIVKMYTLQPLGIINKKSRLKLNNNKFFIIFINVTNCDHLVSTVNGFR